MIGTCGFTRIDEENRIVEIGYVLNPSYWGNGYATEAVNIVLDFAFKLHNDIGFSCKYAYINNSPEKSPIYTRLNNGDKVEIVCEVENGLNVNIAELRWLAYCKNENTQRRLIKYFEKKYN